MRWFQTKELRSSLYALFGAHPEEREEEEDPETVVDDLRDLMLAMTESCATAPGSALVRRIRYARDVPALWFIRSELLQFLSRHEGEAVARAKIDALSSRFDALLPRTLRSRPSPLSQRSRAQAPHTL